MLVTNLLKSTRENYYVSSIAATIAKPLRNVCRRVSVELERKVKKNGVAVPLPNGRTMRIGRDAGVGLASLLFWHGLNRYEVPTCRVLRFFFERAATFVDVGANHGFYSILGPLWNPQLRVVAFEPVPQTYQALVRNLVLNHLQKQVSAHPLALSDTTGTATFYLPNSESKDCEATGTLVGESWQRKKNSPAFDVQTMQFDEFEKLNPMRLDLVKIDVEDFEASVLAGMRCTIERDRPFIVCEILPRQHRNENTRQMIEALGYTPYWITAAGYIRISRFDFDRSTSQDFLLSPISAEPEIVTDLTSLWVARQSELDALRQGQIGGPTEFSSHKGFARR